METKRNESMQRLAGTSYREMVADSLREAIASGELPPGERLNEVGVAKRLGVSATPVREAFRDLVQAGLIEIAPHRGARVRPLTRRDLSEMYSLRADLEQMATRLAHPLLDESDFARLAALTNEMEDCARRGDLTGVVEVDVEFHRHILVRADHHLLLKTWEDIHPSRWTYMTVRMLAGRGPLYIAQRHWPLLEALRDPSLGVAMGAANEHIELIGSEALKALDEDSTEPEPTEPVEEAEEKLQTVPETA